METNNKGLIVWIAILSLSTLGLGGYIVYDKFIADTTNINSEEYPNGEKEDNSFLTYEEIVGTFSNVEMRIIEGLDDTIPVGIEIILKVDKTFIWTGYGVDRIRTTYSGTYSLNNNELRFDVTHYGNCEIVAIIAEECITNGGPLEGFLQYPAYRVVIIDQNTLNYMVELPGFSRKEILRRR